MRNHLAETYRVEEETMLKTAFLSYYISMYNTISKEIEHDEEPVTVDEIYDFIQDLKHEGCKKIPEISKEDISFCFYILRVSGICKEQKPI